MKKLPHISNKPFWDVNIDLQKEETFKLYSVFIIGKIFEYGTLEEMIELILYYGMDQMRELITNSYLTERRLDFCCLVFGLKREDFKCYIRRQLGPKLLSY